MNYYVDVCILCWYLNQVNEEIFVRFFKITFF